MKTASTSIRPDPTELGPPSVPPLPPIGDYANSDLDLDRTLTEIRSGRRLEKVVSCIESFLYSQISRLEKGLAECGKAVDNDEIVKKILADFELEKQAWEAERQLETLRLKEAGEKLIHGWEQLENERRNWLDQRDERGGKGNR